MFSKISYLDAYQEFKKRMNKSDLISEIWNVYRSDTLLRNLTMTDQMKKDHTGLRMMKSQDVMSVHVHRLSSLFMIQRNERLTLDSKAVISQVSVEDSFVQKYSYRYANMLGSIQCIGETSYVRRHMANLIDWLSYFPIFSEIFRRFNECLIFHFLPNTCTALKNNMKSEMLPMINECIAEKNRIVATEQDQYSVPILNNSADGDIYLNRVQETGSQGSTKLCVSGKAYELELNEERNSETFNISKLRINDNCKVEELKHRLEILESLLKDHICNSTKDSACEGHYHPVQPEKQFVSESMDDCDENKSIKCGCKSFEINQSDIKTLECDAEKTENHECGKEFLIEEKIKDSFKTQKCQQEDQVSSRTFDSIEDVSCGNKESGFVSSTDNQVSDLELPRFDLESIEDLINDNTAEDIPNNAMEENIPNEMEVKQLTIRFESSNDTKYVEEKFSSPGYTKVYLNAFTDDSWKPGLVDDVPSMTSSHSYSVDVSLRSLVSDPGISTVGHVSAEWQPVIDISGSSMQKHVPEHPEIKNEINCQMLRQISDSSCISLRCDTFEGRKPISDGLKSSEVNNIAQPDALFLSSSVEATLISEKKENKICVNVKLPSLQVTLRDDLRTFLKKYFIKSESENLMTETKESLRQLNTQMRCLGTGRLMRYFFETVNHNAKKISQNTKYEKVCSEIINHFFRLLKYNNIVQVNPAQAPLTGLDGYFTRVLQGEQLNFRQKMRYEWLRIQSFWSFPINLGISMIFLARNGFYYTGRSTECRCYFCEISHSQWEEGDNNRIAEIHRTISPQCVFLTGGNHDNVPIHSQLPMTFPFGEHSPEHGILRADIVSSELPTLPQARSLQDDASASANLSQTAEVSEGQPLPTQVVALPSASSSTGDALSATPISTTQPDSSQSNVLQSGAEPSLTTTSLTLQSGNTQSSFASSGSAQRRDTFLLDPSPSLTLPPSRTDVPVSTAPRNDVAQSLPPHISIPQSVTRGDAFSQSPLASTIAAPVGTTAATTTITTTVTTTAKVTTVLTNVSNIRPDPTVGPSDSQNRGNERPSESSTTSASAESIAGNSIGATARASNSANVNRAIFRVALRFTSLQFHTELEDPTHSQFNELCAQIIPCIEQLFTNTLGEQRIAIVQFIRDPPVLVVFNIESYNFSDSTAIQQVLRQVISTGSLSNFSVSSDSFQFQHVEGIPSAARPPEHSTTTTAAPRPQRFDPLGINFDRPRFPGYAVFPIRTGTYEGWPENIEQTPIQMSTAGFFYAGYGDYVRCFFCGGGLRNWDAGDDPWTEHAKWFPRCAFLRQNKGEKFVNETQRRHQEQESGIRFEEELEEIVPDEELPAYQSLREMGCQTSDIERAIQIYREKSRPESSQHRPAHMTAAVLIDIISEYEERRATENARLEEASSLIPQHRLTLPSAYSESDHTDKTGIENDTESSLGVRPDSNQARTSSDVEESRRALQDLSISHGTDEGLNASGNEIPVSEAESTKRRESIDELHQLQTENVDLKERLICQVCVDADVAVAFLPCGHLVCCCDCAPAQRYCFICKELIKGTVRIFFP